MSHAGHTVSTGPAGATGDRPGFLAELRDSISVRTVELMIGILLLETGFILSFVGAFHSPAPHRIPISVLAPAQVSGPLVSTLNTIPSAPLQAAASTGQATARRQIRDDSVSAALVVNPAARTDTLLIATAAGASQAAAVERVIGWAEDRRHRSVTVTDIVPLQGGDGHDLTGFYLIIGWIIGGYLLAAVLGVADGARPASTRRAIFRLLAVVPYAVASGLAGAFVAGPVLDALTGHLVALWWLGALLVFASIYALAGIVVTLAASLRRNRRARTVAAAADSTPA